MTERVSFGSRRPIEMSVIQPTTQRSHFCTRDMSRADYVRSPPDLATSPPSWATFFVRQRSATPKGNLGQKVPKPCLPTPDFAAFTMTLPQSRSAIVSRNSHQIRMKLAIKTSYDMFQTIIFALDARYCFRNSVRPKRRRIPDHGEFRENALIPFPVQFSLRTPKVSKH